MAYDYYNAILHCLRNIELLPNPRWMDGWIDGWMDGWMDGWILIDE